MTNEALLVVVLALPFAGSVAAGFLPANARNAEAWLAGALSVAALVACLSFYPEMTYGQVVGLEAAWLPAFGVTFSLRMDGFAWMFCVLVTGIGFLVVLYARYYMSPQDPVPRFFAFFLAFMGAMLGVVLAGNLIQLVFFWELTSLLSFLLIGYWHQNAAARDGARMALIITSAGGLCLFAGVLILGRIAGTYELAGVLEAGSRIRADPLYIPALVLVAAGARNKSAPLPLPIMRPDPKAAPTPRTA